MPRYALGMMLASIVALVPALALARPALLVDVDTARIYYGEDIDSRWHPASLTKIMTAYVAFEAVKEGKLTLEGKLTASERSTAQDPSKIGLPVGGQITVEVALKALIIKSANDVAVMLAEGISGSEEAFVERMNATAARLGMTRTHFVNANGLPAQAQVTTARDLAKLSIAALKDFPQYSSYWSLPDMRMGRRRIGTHNSLLKSYEGADGMKTGFICDSGYNVVASATRDGHKLIAVVLGEANSRDRAIRASSLLEHGFQTSGWKALFNTATLADQPLAPDAAEVVSVRHTVLSRGCGGHVASRTAKARVEVKKKRSRQAKAGETAEAGSAAAAPASGSAGGKARAAAKAQ